jgi:hypothetical protein
MIYLMPESPRYLMKHGRYEKALDSFNQVQTTPLLAARDLMYAHAQLDFESRMLNGNAREFNNLAQRVDVSVPDLPNGSPGLLSVGYTASCDPVSQTDDARNSRLNPAVESLELVRRGGSLQHPNERGVDTESYRQRNSNSFSLDINLDIQIARKKDNPYSYHIGVTGYYRRLRQLWSNMRCRRALLAASVAMISQQMTGVNAIAILGTTVCKSRRSPDYDVC